MTTMDQVVNDAKTLAKSYRAVLALVAKLEEIGDLDKAYEQAEMKLREHKQNAITAENKYKEAKDRLEAVYDEVAQAKEKAADVVTRAEAEAANTLMDASHRTAGMIQVAKQTVVNAEEEVENFHRHVRTENEKHKERMSKNDTEFSEAAERLAILNGELATLRKRIGA